ncbi:MAG: helix-turn-helix domain-containing protein [Candidatus Marinimicrobia bacterium]|jgi:transcriptional regulator with XRE-family HTH domain|nr:helix-turn-helix domain-containing protein [Candidatus Neomarinimicrobiota bacterium]MBT3501533.1 helix-turn-helix domain-containing protein [Candidatus Neomarinimicrobiota bacterium]MBT3840211.1 helix-turn-helix domain-containing protein [Candidatus Neomarinimicrobiota bacterium]MBT3999879.1 helix-turn-helix domain-containing protein [Candidatus Neomarinimicrobiota bacterium]MBT4282924.1 helix-turn-helix domain-containing protein [Candidatus Neomarinimicrobiota bacterium]
MAHFYKELKELRESREISVEEISNRTKIHIRYLQAIETGEFDLIETPYLRLFLRAYAEEIGGDSKRALEQLDLFLGNGVEIPKLSKSILETKDDDIIQNDKPSILSGFNHKVREDIIKGGVLLIIFIFAIFVFQKIFKEESTITNSKTGLELQYKIQPITEYDISANFILNQTKEEQLSVSPPFFLKIRTLNQTAFSFKNDTLAIKNNVLQANWEQDLSPFIKSSEMLFPNTLGLTIFINGLELQTLSNYEYPLRLTIKPSPPSMVIQRYNPIQ